MADILVSPLAPLALADLPSIQGVRIATINSGIRYKGRDDLLLIELAPGTAIAGVFTKSLTCSAPVDICKSNLKARQARAILVNAGNANAFTGKAGYKAAAATARAAAKILGAKEAEIFPASTGVIGEPLPYEKIIQALPSLVKNLSGDRWQQAASAIMTTDTFAKMATRTAKVGGKKIRLNGIAKGSGMIAPDMATMLAFICTDAKIPAAQLQKSLDRAVAVSFNCITVDGDTSTSDTLLLAATGKAGNDKLSDADLRAFDKALQELLIDLACQTVKDGEGAKKFVTIDISGAADNSAARRIGLAIGNSPLVKTAIAGEDANWGRIVMAVGKSGEKADRDRLSISIGGIRVAAKGARVANYDEEPVAHHMKGQAIHIKVDIGIGKGQARIWTCDLTHRYIDINADYRS